MRYFAILFCVLLSNIAYAQIGGKNVYDFLQFPTSSRMEALGGGVQSIKYAKDADLSMAISNPCFIDSSFHKQLAFTNAFYTDKTNIGNIAFAYYHPKIKSAIAYTFQFASYGKFDGRDIAGNSTGTFRAADFNLQVGIGRSIRRFYYGVNIKFIASHAESYTSLGFATDVAIGYHHPKSNWTFAAIVRNAGVEMKPYIKESGRQKLPIQLDISFSKRFKKLPLTLSVTAHNLQTWNLKFPEEEQTTLFGTTKKKSKGAEVVDNIFRHLSFGAEVQAGKPVRLRLGYNHLRRQELGVGRKKGFAGISAGFGVNIKQFAFDYAYAQYHRTGSDHQLSFRIKLDEFGKKAK
ncbi:MAG TPA: type IX secretion system protein PorQ [Chitinophagales bacterium]|nr:type IX secretion system protein PorQ [Chitinophagales bacterium]HNG70852.1 type IX secretion system protein PorQ [Chitinophagales bacterium]HRG35534.1 type IX secretion system protein PorQ [Chitinophagales bacterium]